MNMPAQNSFDPDKLIEPKHADEQNDIYTEEEKKADTKFSKKMVIVCCIAVIGYFALYLVFKWFNPSASWDAALTGCWFGFWGVELVNLATIRRSKIKNKYEKE